MSDVDTGTRPAGLLTVLMPIYNERDTILPCLERVVASPVEKEILIVDDCSTDGTREILRSRVDGVIANVRVVFADENGGKGAAIRTGIPYAHGEWVIIQDGDLEYDPGDYRVLLDAAQTAGVEAAYGSRFLGRRPSMRLPNRIINVLLAAMVRVLYGGRITDEATCYKLFRTDVLRRIPLVCRRFEFCPEVTAKLLRSGGRIVERPISYEPRTHAEGKKIRWTDGVSAIWNLLRWVGWRPPSG